MTDDQFAIEFDFKVLSKSARIIEGIASLPSVDREKEVILKSAIAEALEGFMELPILHLNHTERPVGLVTKAEIRPEGLYIRAIIREKNGSDDVWEKIENGEYGKFSIYGRRRKYSPECRLSPHSRTEGRPCITKGLYLDSISVVDTSAAVNQGTWLSVVKALVADQENYINPEQLTESVTQNVPIRGTQMVDNVENPEVVGGEEIQNSQIEVPETPETPEVQKAESDVTLTDTLAEIQKSLALLVEKHSSEPEKTIEKADVGDEPDIETIVKARVESELTEIQKAFDDKIAELVARIEKMEEETIKKGGEIVVIPQDAVYGNQFGNATALRKFEEVR